MSPVVRRGVLVGVILVQIGVVAAAFNPSPHSGGDNAGYLNLAYSLVERGAYADLHDPAEPPHAKYPPLYPAILAGAMLLGARTWVAFKALSAFFTTVGIALAFFWLEARRGLLFATGVALILVFSDAFVWSGHWILSDPPFVAFTFLSVWALEKADEGDGATATGPPTWWIGLGSLAAVAAYFTRSAGLPLILAVGGWLLLRRRWKGAVAFAGAFLAPAALWWIRGRGSAQGAYVSEFLLVNPYQPELGRVGPVQLASRVLENFQEYATLHVPGGLTGYSGSLVGALGVVLLLLAGVGWARRIGERVSPAELFVPLYGGLILLWPTVWAGDRFALPLYPFLLYYAGDALLEGGKRVGKRAPLVLGTAAVLCFTVPAARVWWDNVQNARICWDLVHATGPFSCYAERLREFVSAARWSGENLPEGSVVITRKPRLFFTLTTLQGRTYPLEEDPEAFFSEAEEVGAGYVVVDYVDNLGRYYLVPVVEERAGSFCALGSWGDPLEVRTELLGILPPDRREELDVEEDEEGALVMDLRRCGAEMVSIGARRLPTFQSPVIPLLSLLDRP